LTDSTDISIDLNWFKKKIKKKDLEEKEFKWGYSPSKGYIGIRGFAEEDSTSRNRS
jgi:hypothetical protein